MALSCRNVRGLKINKTKCLSARVKRDVNFNKELTNNIRNLEMPKAYFNRQNVGKKNELVQKDTDFRLDLRIEMLQRLKTMHNDVQIRMAMLIEEIDKNSHVLRALDAMNSSTDNSTLDKINCPGQIELNLAEQDNNNKELTRKIESAKLEFKELQETFNKLKSKNSDLLSMKESLLEEITKREQMKKWKHLHEKTKAELLSRQNYILDNVERPENLDANILNTSVNQSKKQRCLSRKGVKETGKDSVKMKAKSINTKAASSMVVKRVKK